MMLSNKVKLYIYVLFLFVFSFLFTSRLISAMKNDNFDYLKLAINLLIIGLSIIQIIRYGKKENKKTDIDKGVNS